MATLGNVTVVAQDVADLWRPLTDPETVIADKLLNRAAAILPTRSPGLLDRLNAGTVAPEAVEQVLIQSVLRILRALTTNPEGWKKGSRAGDDYSESWEYDTDTILAALDFTETELRSLLAPGALSRRGKAFVINTTPPR